MMAGRYRSLVYSDVVSCKLEVYSVPFVLEGSVLLLEVEIDSNPRKAMMHGTFCLAWNCRFGSRPLTFQNSSYLRSTNPISKKICCGRQLSPSSMLVF